MSFKLNNSQQLTLHDSFINLPARSQKMLMKSWCRDFAEIVFPVINEKRFAVLYSDRKFSRPNTPVNFIVGALILKAEHNLNDDELIESICFDVRYQYALHTTHLEEQPVSDRTFSRFRERLYEFSQETGRDLMAEEMESLNGAYATYMNLRGNVKRMDSLMVASCCKRMSRLEIVYVTCANAVKLIHRMDCDALLPGSFRHYLEEEDYNKTIYYCKPEEAGPRLEQALQEANTIKEAMAEDHWHEHMEYQLLVRVIREQTDRRDDGSLTPKDKKDIRPDSLQNPSDPDATYREKAGQGHKGYVLNVVETVGEGTSLITGVSYEKNTYSDSQFCRDYLQNREAIAPEDRDPEIMITDGAYGGTDNRKLAEKAEVELVMTCLAGKETDEIFAGFSFNEEGTQVLHCPQGHAPKKTTYYPKTGMCRANFSKTHCGNCLYKDRCKAKEQRKDYAVHVSQKMAARAAYLQKMSTDGYKKLAKMRNAIEGIPSALRRKYHIDQIPVAGKIQSGIFVVTKIMAYNFNKLRQYCRSQREKCALLPEPT